MADDPEQNELGQDLQEGLSRVYKIRLDAMEKAWAIMKEFEDNARANLTIRRERSVRKSHLLEKIQKQLHSIQKLLSDLPNVS